jgi:hypothetical protein
MNAAVGLALVMMAAGMGLLTWWALDPRPRRRRSRG